MSQDQAKGVHASACRQAFGGALDFVIVEDLVDGQVCEAIPEIALAGDFVEEDFPTVISEDGRRLGGLRLLLRDVDLRERGIVPRRPRRRGPHRRSAPPVDRVSCSGKDFQRVEVLLHRASGFMGCLEGSVDDFFDDDVKLDLWHARALRPQPMACADRCKNTQHTIGCGRRA